MVAIIENYAAVSGNIVGVDEHPARPGYWQLSLQLEKSEDIGGYPNLAKADEGTVISIAIKKQMASKAALQPGMSYTAEVKKVSPQEYFIRS